MVTVIADNEALPTPAHNGVTAGSNDNEKHFQYIKEFQEVDFHRSSSCKPLPEDLVGLHDGQITKSSISGTFLVQIDSVKSFSNFNNHNNKNQSGQTDDFNSLLLTVTDGNTTLQGITTDYIHNLSLNTRPGSKLLLTGVILIKNGLLQLTHDNTRFQYGSNKYPRPRAAYRGRGVGSHRPSYEGRRGGTGDSNNRYDNDDSPSNFLKRPLPKTTLMDFMTSLKITNDIKQISDDENQILKDRHETKRRNTDHHYQTFKQNPNVDTTNTLINNNSNHYSISNNNHNHKEQTVYQQDGNHDQLDPEDDISHPNYRERRNPLPPRLQRVHEERNRRNTYRYYDESASLNGSEINCNYQNGTMNNISLSSSSSYSQCGDPMSYMVHNSSTCQPHSTPLNTYAPHVNMLASGIGSTPTSLTYFPATTGHFPYNLAGIPSSPFHSQQASIVSGYNNDPLVLCSAGPYIAPTYLSSTVTNDSNEDSKDYDNSSVVQTEFSVDEGKAKTTNESQADENNHDNEDYTQIPSSEQIASSSVSSTTSALSNEENNNSHLVLVEQPEDKCSDGNKNQRIRWKIGDTCLARWSEDQEFYTATIVQIQPPHCVVMFLDYNTYDKVHFSELKLLPCDPQYYQFVPSIPTLTPDLNVLGTNACYPPRANYYTPVVDEYIIMPEVPPFPFNSAGTLYMCPSTFTSISRSTRYNTNGFTPYQQTNKRIENGIMYNANHTNADITINSLSTSSKDSNDTSINDSTVTSADDGQKLKQNDVLLVAKEIQKCSIADRSIKSVTNIDEYNDITTAESVINSDYHEQQSTNEVDKQENNSVVQIN